MVVELGLQRGRLRIVARLAWLEEPGLEFIVVFFVSSHLFSRAGSGWSCFTGTLPDMRHFTGVHC